MDSTHDSLTVQANVTSVILAFIIRIDIQAIEQQYDDSWYFVSALYRTPERPHVVGALSCDSNNLIVEANVTSMTVTFVIRIDIQAFEQQCDVNLL